MINSSTKADSTYSVDQFIDMRSSDDITYYNYSILAYHNGFEYAITNILYDYIDELEEQTVIVKLSQEEMNKYIYKPWLFAYDIYGSVDSSFVIMILNGILADSDFDFNRIKILMPADLTSLLSRIYSANSVYLNNNKSDVALEEKNDNAESRVW